MNELNNCKAEISNASRRAEPKETEILYTCKKTTAHNTGDLWLRSTRHPIPTTKSCLGQRKIQVKRMEHANYISRRVRKQMQYSATEKSWEEIREEVRMQD